MAKFRYGYDGMGDRQLATLATFSTKATQSISTTQTTLLGWNGKEISNTANTTPMMVSLTVELSLCIISYLIVLYVILSR